MGESTRWSRMLTRLPIHQTWHDRNENPKQAAYPVQILKLRRTREFPENVRIGGSTPICAMHEPPSTQPDPPQPDPKGHHSRPSGLPPSPPAEESANRARQTDPGPGRGAPSAAGTRGRRDRSQPRSWSPWSAPGPHATGHPWSSPGTSGHDQRTRTAGHTAPHPGCRGPPALANKAGITRDGPHPPVQLVTVAVTPEPAWSSPAVPSTCP
jgi:hypothetical protein